MNKQKINHIILDNYLDDKNNKEQSYEEYQIIKEDYCSSPKCGIRSKIVTKSVEKIIFSPIEISSKPYFKYSVSQEKGKKKEKEKDEHLKYDFSQSETNHTRINEDKNQKKNINNISNYQKSSYLEININELKEEKNENEFDEENGNISKYLNSIDKKENDINIHFNTDDNKENIENKEKKKLRNKNKKVVIQNDIHNNFFNKKYRSITLKEKRKLNLNDISVNKKKKEKT